MKNPKISKKYLSLGKKYLKIRKTKGIKAAHNFLDEYKGHVAAMIFAGALVVSLNFD